MNNRVKHYCASWLSKENSVSAMHIQVVLMTAEWEGFAPLCSGDVACVRSIVFRNATSIIFNPSWAIVHISVYMLPCPWISARSGTCSTTLHNLHRKLWLWLFCTTRERVQKCIWIRRIVRTCVIYIRAMVLQVVQNLREDARTSLSFFLIS